MDGHAVSSDSADYDAYRSAELASLYDAVYVDAGDTAFWYAIAPRPDEGPLLELGCGTGRLLLPLARAGHTITGIDLAPSMLGRCREELQSEPIEVRERVTLLEADMTDFALDDRFAQVFCAFGTFHHLGTAEQQLACLARCREHLLPAGTLVLDLINPDPAPPISGDAQAADDGAGAQPDRVAPSRGAASASPTVSPAEIDGSVAWTHGRRVRSWAAITDTQRSLQLNRCEVTYEVLEVDGSTRRLTETFPMRFIFRYELEHLLARSGFRVLELYGDYDRSPFVDDSLGMIVVARPLEP